MIGLRRFTGVLLVAVGLAVAATGCSVSGGGPAPSISTSIPTSLPPAPPPPAPRRQIVLFLPHADDELLSMGVLIQREVASHHDVRLVLYTSGAGTGVCQPDRHGICRGDTQFRHLTTAQFSALRDSELEHSAAALGVPAGKLQFYAPNGVRRLDGTVTVSYALTMLRYYRHLYPAATFVTMSWLDRHPDHAAGGIALRMLVRDGTIPASDALFTIYRRYWEYDYPHRAAEIRRDMDQIRVSRGYPLSARLLRCATPACRRAIHRAVLAYYPRKLGGTGYGIGWRSARRYLAVTDADPESLVHGVAAGRYPVRASIVTVRGDPWRPGDVLVQATVTVPDFGHYGMNPDLPASAPYLVQSLRGRTVRHPLPLGTLVVLAARNSAGRVLTSTHVPLEGTHLTAALRLPAGAVRLTLDTPGSEGALPAHVSASLG